MSKKWTQTEDYFLMEYHKVGPDFIAKHDLGRPHGAGTRRMNYLRKNGALEAYAKLRLIEIDLAEKCGRPSPVAGDLREEWQGILSECIASNGSATP